MARTVYIALGVAALLCVAGIAAAAVAGQRQARDCTHSQHPERCEHNQRLRAYCAEHPDDAHHCADHPSNAERHRHYCQQHPDDAEHCRAHDDTGHDAQTHDERMREYCQSHPDDQHHCGQHA